MHGRHLRIHWLSDPKQHICLSATLLPHDDASIWKLVSIWLRPATFAHDSQTRLSITSIILLLSALRGSAKIVQKTSFAALDSDETQRERMKDKSLESHTRIRSLTSLSVQAESVEHLQGCRCKRFASITGRPAFSSFQSVGFDNPPPSPWRRACRVTTNDFAGSPVAPAARFICVDTRGVRGCRL